MSDKKFDGPFVQKPDSGTFKAAPAKTNPNAADYYGEIHVNLNDMTAIKMENGNHVIKLSGWKRTDKNGKAYLSLKVNRYVPKEESAPVRQTSHDEEDPF
jgi:hypothetical protein